MAAGTAAGRGDAGEDAYGAEGAARGVDRPGAGAGTSSGAGNSSRAGNSSGTGASLGEGASFGAGRHGAPSPGTAHAVPGGRVGQAGPGHATAAAQEWDWFSPSAPGENGSAPERAATPDASPARPDRFGPAPSHSDSSNSAPSAPGWSSSTPSDSAPSDAASAPAGHDAAPNPTGPAAASTSGDTASSGCAPSTDAVLIRRTLALVEPVADRTTSYFYALLFLRHPELRDLFPVAMNVQRDRLFQALLDAAQAVDDPARLTDYLSRLGRGHRKYGTRPEHYPAVGECLIGALTKYASEIWNDEVEAAWVRAYTAISQIMIDAAAEDEMTSPAWWQAEIVSHERRTPDVAVVTVRPDQPYPFLAGQYTSIETPWWPRVWRHYSFASAPRPDGLLSFHIKAVPAGWVSTAMVNRAGPGDVIRLGPPAGSMIVDHGTDNGLLCLGGGTGIAPIKALVEDVADRGRRRPMEVFYAARNDHDLYDLDTMLRMEREHSWLSVRPVVAEGPAVAHGLFAGALPEIVRRHGPWDAYDAYLSGPPGMIRSSVDALIGAGMPTHRIRHDSLDELASARA
ncbi:globin domain-containing protein [Streptomyces sp. ICBB 8177]|uniref:globin domain-containing protein n=1 Tax=Streptomyces sp. ICBB 8177 TaxID=563922 RepID=UPI0018EEB6FA|nr:globin domain-containing protein [Streptomyces sp. ICBB 8177]